MSNLLFIDNSINDIECIIKSLNADTKYIVIDAKNTLQDIKNKFENIKSCLTTNTNVGILQENFDKDYYEFMNNKSILKNVSKLDAKLNSWYDYTNFLSYLKLNLNINQIDFISCEIKNDNNWTYVLDKIAKNILLKINTSDKKMGSKILGGTWNLNNDNLIGKLIELIIFIYVYMNIKVLSLVSNI